LINDTEIAEIKEILKSPLDLSFRLISDFIENNLDMLRENLDKIKGFVAGIDSATKRGKNYVIASMYPYYFAFHQYVHSSFRARQGKVLEEIIKSILMKEKDFAILNKIEQKKEFDTSKKNLPDYDIFLKSNDRLVIIQIRSRDDTGGTTAKTSLVEGIKYIEEFYKGSINNIEYIAFVWEGLGEQQQGTTKEKFYDYLKGKTSLNKEEFFRRLVSVNKEGVDFEFGKNKLNLYLVYGQDDFVDLLSEKLILSENLKKNLIKLLQLISDWDDFWMAYQYIGLEYERLKLHKFSYIHYLIKELGITKDLRNTIKKISSLDEYILLADKLTSEVLKKDIDLPFRNGKDSYIYIRDLILIIFIYYKRKI